MSSEFPVADQVSIRENKLALVERLADDLAHEIKNPLHSMVINLEVLRRRIARLENGTQGELLRYANVLNTELDRVNRRVDLLLRIMRPNGETDDLVSLAEIFDELQELIELECERSRVALTIDLGLPFVRARLPRSTTRQMILGLTLKTLDSVPAGGTLRLIAEPVRGAMCLRFEALDSLGEPAGPDRAPHEGALLPVARALAASMGGEIEVVSDVTARRNGFARGACRYVLSLPAGE